MQRTDFNVVVFSWILRILHQFEKKIVMYVFAHRKKQYTCSNCDGHDIKRKKYVLPPKLKCDPLKVNIKSEEKSLFVLFSNVKVGHIV